MPDTSAITVIHPLRPIDAVRELNRLAVTIKDAMIDPQVGGAAYIELRRDLHRVTDRILALTPADIACPSTKNGG